MIRITATMTPIAPAKMDSVEIMPPRVLGSNEISTPIAPSTRAAIAMIRLKPGPVVKLRTAAMTAKIETRLKAGDAGRARSFMQDDSTTNGLERLKNVRVS